MTAPIQEPSVYRTQSGHSWGISQLARRPAIAPSTDLVAARAILNQHYETIGNNNDEVQIAWDVTQTSDSSVFDWQDDDLHILQTGAYLVTGYCKWRVSGGNGVPNGPTGLILYGLGPLEGWANIVDPAVQANQANFVTALLLLPSITDATDGVPMDRILALWAVQHAADGLTHDIAEAHFQAVRLGSQPLLHDPAA